MASKFLKHLLAPWIFIFVASLIKILRVANGIIMEAYRFGPVNALALTHKLLNQPFQSPAASSIAAMVANVNAGVLFVYRNARGRHASGEVR